MGTHWELKRNIVETHWELGKKEKKSPHLECMRGPSNWWHEIFLPKKVSHYFLAWANTPCKEHPTYYYVNSFVFPVNSTLWLKGPNIVKNSNTRLNILCVGKRLMFPLIIPNNVHI